MITEVKHNQDIGTTLKPELRLVAWEITRSCNLFCSHCRASANPGSYDDELTTEECYRLVDQILGGRQTDYHFNRG